MKLVWFKLALMGFFIFLTYRVRPITIALSQSEVQRIGKLILQNECGGKVDNLIFWNEAEAFPSLGIGHFIWFPRNKNLQFEQTFPELIGFLQKHTVLPAWLKDRESHQFCPWRTRAEFIAASGSAHMLQLKKFLLATIDLQAEFIVRRFERSLKPLVTRYPHIKGQVLRLLRTPGGVCAMIDYANFKGLGLTTLERYNNCGWGLLQVLERMKGTAHGKSALTDFVAQAKHVLHMRVQNAPPTTDERRFLLGWCNRLDRYVIG